MRYKPLEKNVPFLFLFGAKENNKYRRSSNYLKTITGLITGLLFFSSLPAAGGLLPLNELIAKAQDRYEKTGDLKAQFTQEVTIRAMDKTEKEEGVLYVKNPRRMLWSYSKPKAKKLIINPKKAWLYIPDDHAVYIQDTENIYKSKLAVKFLSGIGKLSEDFHVGFSRPDPVDASGNYLLTLTPKVPEAGVDKLHLTVDKDTFQIIQCSFTDLYGNTTRIRLTDIRINNNLDDKLFNFKPPSGVEIFNMPQ